MVKVPVWRCQYDKMKVDHPASMICETCAPASPKLGKMWLDLVNKSFNSVMLFWNICQLNSALPSVSRDSLKMVSTQCSPAGEHWVDTILRLSRETDGKALFNWHMFQKSMTELKDLFTKSNHIFPSLGDAGAHVSQIMDAGWSTFILSYWHRQTGTFTMGEAIQKMTSGPAKVLGQEP